MWSCKVYESEPQPNDDNNSLLHFVHCLFSYKCFLFFCNQKKLCGYYCAHYSFLWIVWHLFCCCFFFILLCSGFTVRNKQISLYVACCFAQLLFHLFWLEWKQIKAGRQDISLVKWLSRHRITSTISFQFWFQSHQSKHNQFICYCSGTQLFILFTWIEKYLRFLSMSMCVGLLLHWSRFSHVNDYNSITWMENLFVAENKSKKKAEI